jgi:hypothetical protein
MSSAQLRKLYVSRYRYILATTDIFLQGVDRSPDLRKLNDAELLAFIETKMWNP